MSEETDKTKKQITVWETMTTRMLIRRIAFMGAVSACFYAGIAYCADNPIDTAERIDKLGATGVLAFGFLMSIGALVYLIHLIFGQLKDMIEKNTVVMTQVSDTIKECKYRGN